jgi:hypothetical protein
VTNKPSYQAKLRTLGWTEPQLKPLQHALAALGPGRITKLAAEEVRFTDREQSCWIWTRGRCLTKDEES